jgi:hypothetical protein
MRPLGKTRIECVVIAAAITEQISPGMRMNLLTVYAPFHFSVSHSYEWKRQSWLKQVNYQFSAPQLRLWAGNVLRESIE